jgi:hypothetical protein
MRIVQKTPTQLIAQNSVFGIWLGSGLLVVLGVSIFAVPVTSADEQLNLQVYAYVFIALGVVTLLTSGKFITWTFDKSDDSLTVQFRVLFVTKTSKYSLKEIEKVQIESKMTGDGGTDSFGIELMLIGGEQLHLCPNFNLSEFTAKEGVRRLSSFLDH